MSVAISAPILAIISSWSFFIFYQLLVLISDLSSAGNHSCYLHSVAVSIPVPHLTPIVSIPVTIDGFSLTTGFTGQIVSTVHKSLSHRPDQHFQSRC
jgi:hypothetical protein